MPDVAWLRDLVAARLKSLLGRLCESCCAFEAPLRLHDRNARHSSPGLRISKVVRAWVHQTHLAARETHLRMQPPLGPVRQLLRGLRCLPQSSLPELSRLIAPGHTQQRRRAQAVGCSIFVRLLSFLLLPSIIDRWASAGVLKRAAEQQSELHLLGTPCSLDLGLCSSSPLVLQLALPGCLPLAQLLLLGGRLLLLMCTRLLPGLHSVPLLLPAQGLQVRHSCVKLKQHQSSLNSTCAPPTACPAWPAGLAPACCAQPPLQRQ